MSRNQSNSKRRKCFGNFRIFAVLMTCVLGCLILTVYHEAAYKKSSSDHISSVISARCVHDTHWMKETANETYWNCLPQYLGIGFPKCGSSSIWKYLKQHPMVSLLFFVCVLLSNPPLFQTHTLFIEIYLFFLKQIVLYRRGKTKEAHFFHQPRSVVRQSLPSYVRSFPSMPTSSVSNYTVGEHTPGYVWRVPYTCSPHPSSKNILLYLLNS
jgi:hypothetical protein